MVGYKEVTLKGGTLVKKLLCLAQVRSAKGLKGHASGDVARA